jgi:predicted nucleic acid-binding protein
MIVLLDTNILVRFLTGDRDPRYESLGEFFASLESGDIQVELKLIVLFQTLFVLKSFYNVPQDEIASALLALLQFKGLKIREKQTVRRTLKLWRNKKSRLEIVDCYLVACLERDHQNVLYSYDRDFDRFEFNRREP